ncbi:MAG: NAD-dependent epimerase/dehydratase family protein [Thermoleophilaceae bacterium]
MAERTILITGAGGFLGGHVLRGLAERAEVSTVALARRPLTDPPGRVVQAVALLAELTGETWSRLGVGRFDTAIHLAGFMPKRTDQGDVRQRLAGSVDGTRRLLGSLKGICGRMLLASSTDVYGEETGAPRALTERSPAAPTTPYATAKLECERLVAGTGDGWEPVILRCGQLYGPGDEEHAKLVPHTTRRLLSGLPPVVLGDGRAQRDLLYVADAAEAVVRAALARRCRVWSMSSRGGRTRSTTSSRRSARSSATAVLSTASSPNATRPRSDSTTACCARRWAPRSRCHSTMACAPRWRT